MHPIQQKQILQLLSHHQASSRNINKLIQTFNLFHYLVPLILDYLNYVLHKYNKPKLHGKLSHYANNDFNSCTSVSCIFELYGNI